MPGNDSAIRELMVMTLRKEKREIRKTEGMRGRGELD
jgi:hypothetical protein